MKVLASYNIKGGVGKTTTAVNLAWSAAAGGVSTLLWDLDPQGAATFFFRVEPKVDGGARKLLVGRKPIGAVIRETDIENLDLLPADFSYRKLDLHLDRSGDPGDRLVALLAPLAGHYEIVVLDCPPSVSLLSESVFRVADALLVPTIPTTLSMRMHEKLVGHLADLGLSRRVAVLPFFTMVDGRKTLHREICASAGPEFLQTRIPASSEVERMGVHRAPLGSYAPRSDATKAHARLWVEVLERLGIGGP